MYFSIESLKIAKRVLDYNSIFLKNIHIHRAKNWANIQLKGNSNYLWVVELQLTLIFLLFVFSHFLQWTWPIL